ncbi:MAG: T9SS type A sorting domain-containing protein [candidate division WOR-3 bacterium]
MKGRILVLTLLVLIFSSAESQYSFDLSCLSDTLQIVAPNGVANFHLRLTNTGSLNDIYELNCRIVESVPGWFATVCLRGVCVQPGTLLYDTLQVGQSDTTIHITVYTTATNGREVLSFAVRSLGNPTLRDSIRVYTQVGQGIEEDASASKVLFFTPIIYPNPIKTQTTIRFTPYATPTGLKIYDISGKLVKYFLLSHHKSYCLIWDGRDQTGQLLPTGTYIITFIHNNKTVASKPITIIK